jgi:hypothetical protein
VQQAQPIIIAPLTKQAQASVIRHPDGPRTRHHQTHRVEQLTELIALAAPRPSRNKPIIVGLKIETHTPNQILEF